jgi:cob(I)alamin adenosyltransferase
MDKCPDCITPAGTRCESAPGNCPYVKAAQLPDVADCCETLEEARAVIRRMVRRIEDLEDEVNVLRHEV